jgi:hypothetical protein
MYCMEEEVTISTMPYIDDDLTPLALKAVNQLHTLLLYMMSTQGLSDSTSTPVRLQLCASIPLHPSVSTKALHKLKTPATRTSVQSFPELSQ